MGEEGVIKLLQKKQKEVADQYQTSVVSSNFDKRMSQLAKIRNEDGYMVKLNVLKNKYEML